MSPQLPLMLFAMTTLASALGAAPANDDSFYPSPADVQQSLDRFMSLRKQAPFEGLMKQDEADRLHADYVANPDKYKGHEWLKIADYWAGKSDEFLREMMPGENPRQLVPNYGLGCPLHLGSIVTLKPIWGRRNCWRCEVGHEEWGPGMKVKVPETGAEVMIEDDGYGWECPKGFPNPGRYYFVAAYRLFLIRCLVSAPYMKPVEFDGPIGRGPIWCLGWAYALTRNPVYAQKALVILAGIADIYPTGNSLYTWHTYPARAYLDDHNFECNILHNSVQGYDMMFGGIEGQAAVLEWFRQGKDRDYNGDGKVGYEDLKYHIDRDFFGRGYEFVHRSLPLARGNSRTWQFAVMMEMALHFRHDVLMDEALNGRYGLKQLLTNCVYRDGRYYEDSTGYAIGVNNSYLEQAKYLEAFRGRKLYPEGLKADEVLGPLYTSVRGYEARINCAGRLPEWGDAGGTRTPLYHPREKPQPSDLMGDIGFSIMRSAGSSAQQLHLMLNFTQNGAGHGHHSQLMIKPIMWGYDLSADHGYPFNLQSPKRAEWIANAATHNTVVVDSRDQRTGSAGSLDYFLDTPNVKATAAHCANVYENTSLYHRTAVLVSLGDEAHFFVDVFRVKGGERRDYLWHGQSGWKGDNFTLNQGANPAPQPRPGTLAGPDVAFMADTGKGPYDSLDEQPERRSGYSYLKDVELTQGVADWSCQWRVGDEKQTSMNLWMVGAPGRQLYLARGEHNGAPGISPWDRYIIARDDNGATGSETSVYCAAFEPVQGAPKTQRVTGLPVVGKVDEGLPVGVKVETSAGSFIVLSSLRPERVYRFRDGEQTYQLQGSLAVLRVPAMGEGEVAHVNCTLADFGVREVANRGAYRGKVAAVEFDKVALIVRSGDKLPAGTALAGQTIKLSQPEWIKNSVFRIKEIVANNDGTWLIKLDAPSFVSAAGTIDQVNPDSVFTKDSLEKLFNCHRLYDGKALYTADRKEWFQIATARPGYYAVADVTMKLKDPQAAAHFKPGDRFVIAEANPGADFEIDAVGQ
ncbi:MAG: heparinase II/III family protein [Armatimonadia bacterium]